MYKFYHNSLKVWKNVLTAKNKCFNIYYLIYCTIPAQKAFVTILMPRKWAVHRQRRTTSWEKRQACLKSSHFLLIDRIDIAAERPPKAFPSFT